jgi:hypothetical protein
LNYDAKSLMVTIMASNHWWLQLWCPIIGGYNYGAQSLVVTIKTPNHWWLQLRRPIIGGYNYGAQRLADKVNAYTASFNE